MEQVQSSINIINHQKFKLFVTQEEPQTSECIKQNGERRLGFFTGNE